MATFSSREPFHGAATMPCHNHRGTSHQPAATSACRVPGSGYYFRMRCSVLYALLALSLSCTSDPGTPLPTLLASDGNAVYWFDSSHGLMMFPISGGSATQLAASPVGGSVTGLAANAERVVWTEGCSLVSLPVNSVTSKMYAYPNGCPLGPMAVDDINIYWIDRASLNHRA